MIGKYPSDQECADHDLEENTPAWLPASTTIETCFTPDIFVKIKNTRKLSEFLFVLSTVFKCVTQTVFMQIPTFRKITPEHFL